MKFYYVCESQENEREYVCCHNAELKTKDFIAIEVSQHFIIAKVGKRIDELDVLTNNYDAKEVIQAIDVSKYIANKEAKVKRILLMASLEDKCKEVKLLETLKKYSEKDDEMREMFSMFESLVE